VVFYSLRFGNVALGWDFDSYANENGLDGRTGGAKLVDTKSGSLKRRHSDQRSSSCTFDRIDLAALNKRARKQQVCCTLFAYDNLIIYLGCIGII
jgi:hypothetical protein